MPSRAPTPAAVSTAAKRSAYSSNIYNGSSPVNNGGYSEKEWLLNLLSGTRSDQTSSDGDIEANEISNGDNGVVTNGSSDIIIKQKSPRKSSESILVVATLIILWMGFNLGTTVMNKAILPTWRFPIMLTALHMMACTILSFFAVHILRLFPAREVPLRSPLFFKLVILAAATCSSIVFGNYSLQYLALSYDQMIGSTTPFFTALFAFMITRRRESALTYATLVPVVVGIMLSTKGESHFVLFGAFMATICTALRAFKTVLQAWLLQSETERLDSMNLMLYTAPLSVLMLVPVALFMEPHAVNDVWLTKANHMLLLLSDCVCAYLMNLFNFLVTSKTSALTLQIAGAAKGALGAYASWCLFHDPITSTGIIGYGMTLAGCVAYTESQRRTKGRTN